MVAASTNGVVTGIQERQSGPYFDNRQSMDKQAIAERAPRPIDSSHDKQFRRPDLFRPCRPYAGRGCHAATHDHGALAGAGRLSLGPRAESAYVLPTGL